MGARRKSIRVKQPLGTRFLHPAFLSVAAGILPALMAMSIKDSNFRILWRTPQFITRSDLNLAIALAAIFTVGVIMGGRSRWAGWHMPDRPTEVALATARVGRVLLVISLAAYLIMAGAALIRGVDIPIAISALRGETGAIAELKSRMRPIGGVTTFNQLAGPGLGFLLYSRASLISWSRRDRWLVVVTTIAVVLRSVLYAERLALIEFLLPSLVVFVFHRTGKSRSRSTHRRTFAVAIALLGVVLLYGAQEYYRSWLPYYDEVYEGSFVQYTSDRLVGYYVTAINNSSILLHHVDVPAGAYVLGAARDAPLIGSELGGPFDFKRTLEQIGNPEFNNPGGLLALYADAGIFVVPSILLSGLVIGRLYARIKRQASPVMVVYGVMVVGILEMSRIPYFALARGIIPVVGSVVAVRWIRKSANQRYVAAGTLSTRALVVT